MRLLLDTHALLWALIEPELLTEGARTALQDGRNEVYVSAASVWEVAIKRALGQLAVPDDLVSVVTASGFAFLSVSAGHASAAGSLPPHHRDPFDRMLVAQASLESLTLVTRDARFAAYRVPVLGA